MGRWARKPVNHTSWVALVTPTDRPKSVRNRCLIELFCGVVCVVTLPFYISVGVGSFVIGLSQISSFFSFSDLCTSEVEIWVSKNCFCSSDSFGTVFSFSNVDRDTSSSLSSLF